MHTLILGTTGTGKSALAKQLGSQLRNKGLYIVAFNPTKEEGYTRRDAFGCVAADFESDDPEIFVAELKRAAKQFDLVGAIVDEAHEFFDRGNCKYKWIGTKGRHYGIHLIAITQSATQINVTVRGQCSVVYLFPCSRSETRFVADQYFRAGVTEESLQSLDDGEFLRIQGRNYTKGNLSDFSCA